MTAINEAFLHLVDATRTIQIAFNMSNFICILNIRQLNVGSFSLYASLVLPEDRTRNAETFKF